MHQSVRHAGCARSCMMQLGLVTVGGFLLSLAALWLLMAGPAGTLPSGGFGAGMSLFPVVLACASAGLVATGPCHRPGRR